VGLAAEDRAVAVVDEHDHDGIGARVMLGSAVRAAADVAGLAALARRAAVRAEAVAAMPVEQRDAVGEHPAVGLREHRGEVAQPATLAREVVARIGGEHGAPAAVDAEEHELETVRQLVDPDEPRALVGHHDARVAGEDHARLRVRQPCGEPRVVAPVRPGAVERLAGERVRTSQAG
jgi:hypothetical protein